MYRYDSGQISVDDFEQPVGMNIKADNPKSKADSLGNPRDAICRAVPVRERERGQAAAVGVGSLYHPGGIRVFR
jgi:hypothetical protein